MPLRLVLPATAVVAVVLTAAAAIAAPNALGHTTIVAPEGSHFPYQRWVNEAQVPTPDVTLNVVEVPWPCGDAAACTDGATIEFAPDIYRSEAPYVFFHEIGHVYGDAVLSEAQRQWFVNRTDGTAWIGLPDETRDRDEWFADAYAFCALADGDIGWESKWYYLGRKYVRARIVRQTCALIYRADPLARHKQVLEPANRGQFARPCERKFRPHFDGVFRSGQGCGMNRGDGGCSGRCDPS
jgi:hypothetical protein